MKTKKSASKRPSKASNRRTKAATASETTAAEYQPARPRTNPTAEAVHNAALEPMAVSVDAIRDQIDEIATGKTKPSRRDPGSLIASLGAKAGAIYEATRKAEAARLKRIQSITPALVLAWFRQLDRTDREHMLRELSVIESRKSGLA